ncbi:tautomerase family protein [Nocardia sp. NPDC046473]|uniref:tautomerase family protein n=1 Tax=Nocardia sp. NPDC046473 TaxID=3155733 RepID=UPI003405F5D6
MPLVRIDYNDSRTSAQAREIADAVHEALVAVLGIPARDRFQILTPHRGGEIIALDAGLGFERTSGVVIVQIFTQGGRGIEVKQQLFRSLAEHLEPVGVHGPDLFIGISENAPQDWSFGFGVAQYVTGELAALSAGE